MIQKILVVFKTHLDLGFTGFSNEIYQRYMKEYIPKAMEVGEQIAASGRKEGFVWSIGSWLIEEYLKQASPENEKRMCRAIQNGIIRWHALPFTMHSELADRALYQYGLGISKKLDRRFGMSTTSAKYTDVPGHTRAIVPLLSNAGVHFLHIGVNPASQPPAVPDLFRWRAPSGESVVVMYSKGDYGDFSEIPGTGIAVFFAHTGDNRGPQSQQEVLTVYDGLHRDFPQAEIKAASLEDVAQIVKKIEDSLPIVEEEIGDTWIHGVGTDAKKVCQFRELLRLASRFDNENQERLYQGLLPIAEHTWGLDEKTFLHDHKHFSRAAFEQARKLPEYQTLEKSWAEQRAYISSAVSSLTEPAKSMAQQACNEYRTDFPCTDGMQRLDVGEKITINGWSLSFDEQGAINFLKKDGRIIADSEHRLGVFEYQVFSEKEVLDYTSRYDRLHADWSIEDFGKVGLEKALADGKVFRAKSVELFYNHEEVFSFLTIHPLARESFGCPSKMMLRVHPQKDRVEFDFCWLEKPACRIPEGCSLGFSPVGALVSIEKMGEPIDPRRVVSGGNREMHAVSQNLQFETCLLETLDAPLVSISKPFLYGFYDQIPPMDKGIWFILFNNQWGTNFPMWYEDDARFRFILRLSNMENNRFSTFIKHI